MDASDPLELIGQTLRGSWRIERLVHVGALSHVYRVRRETDGRHGALKCYVGLAGLSKALQHNVRDAFVRVGRDVGRLSRSYEGLARPLGGGWMEMDDGTEIPCVILEWLAGKTLEAMLDAERGRFRRTATEALALMAAPLEVLAAAHQLGLAHRDIKPSNFFVCADTLTPDAPIRLLDLSLAKLSRRGETSMPRPGVLFMTPNYAAPEQFRGDDPLIGPWTDVFGVALVLIELMAGYGPVMQGHTLEALQAASEDRNRRPSPRTLGLDVPNTVDAVFKRALAVDVAERYRDVGAFLRALYAAAAAEDRVTSSVISRVSGTLDFDPGQDPGYAPPQPLEEPVHAAPSGTVIASAPQNAAQTPDHTVIAEAPAPVAYTKLSGRPVRRFEPE